MCWQATLPAAVPPDRMSHPTRPDEPGSSQRDRAQGELESLRREVERLGVLGTRDSGILQALLENSQHGILVSDPAGRIHVQSRAAEQIWAGSASTSNVEGWRQYRASHEDGRPYEPTDWGMARALATRQKVDDREIHIQRFDGTFGWLIASSAPFFTADGELAGAIGVFADITSLKQSEAEARRLEAALASKVAALESFAQRASGLQKMMAMLGASLSVADVASAIAAHGPGLFGATAALLYVLDDDGSSLRVVSHGGVSAERVAAWRDVPLASGNALAECVRADAPILVGDRDALLARWPELADVALDGRPLVGLAVVPLRDTEGPLGGLAFSFYDGPLLDAVQRDMYLTVASQCGIAIQRARSFAVAKRALEAETRANERLLLQQRRLTVLADLTETLATAFDSRQALEDLARAAVPILGDWCRIDEVDEDGAIRNLAVYHKDPERQALGTMLAQRWPPAKDAPSGIARALRTGEVEFQPNVSEETLRQAARDPEHLEVLRGLGLTSYATVPMTVRGRTLGAIMLATEGERRLTDDDVRFAEELARRAALALENTRLYEAAEASRARLHDLFMQMPASISILNGSELRFELINRAGQQLVARQVLGLPARDALPELIGQGFFEMLDDARRTGETTRAAQVPLRMAWAGGEATERCFDFINQPLRDREGRVDGIVSFAFDVTEQVAVAMDNARLYADAQRLIAALEATNRELDQFAYVASHDLKAPLRGIGSLAEWIEEDLGDAITDDARTKLALLRRRVHRMEGLIQGILDFSRIGRRPGKEEQFSVARLVAESWDLLSPPATATLTVDDGLPSLVTERVALQQVFLNLMGNALKHGGRPDVRVDVSVADAGEWWEFRVADNGPGIAPEFHERVWGIFQILEARDKVESTGIGLAVVKKIIENKGGKAWIEESPSGGAAFVFRWPRRAEGRAR